MGNRTGLWIEHAAGEPVLVFEANNTLPLFWCAAFRPADLAAWTAAAQGPLELRVPWPVALANLRAALQAAPGRMPGFEARLAAFAAALEATGARLGATALLLDAAEWTNFFTQDAEAAAALGRMIATWHGEGPPGPPAEALHGLYQVDGLATAPAMQRAQAAWPPVPLEPMPPAPRQASDWSEWAWVALIAAATIGGYAATESVLVAGLAFIATSGVFIATLLRQPPG
jgi:hypothetical protein